VIDFRRLTRLHLYCIILALSNLYVRDVPAEEIEALRDLALESGRSLAAEVRMMIHRAVADRLEAPAQV
jgi:plasmid stability protein